MIAYCGGDPRTVPADTRGGVGARRGERSSTAPSDPHAGGDLAWHADPATVGLRMFGESQRSEPEGDGAVVVLPGVVIEPIDARSGLTEPHGSQFIEKLCIVRQAQPKKEKPRPNRSWTGLSLEVPGICCPPAWSG
ncbi:MAG: hypothetical protein JWO18_2807 [Microbacteriaceae bacterium]|nr:hypothetical protein [Microbacteriaceae bacterium]